MTKKYDMFMEALQHLCEVHEVSLEALYVDIEVWDRDQYDNLYNFTDSFVDCTKEPQ